MSDYEKDRIAREQLAKEVQRFDAVRALTHWKNKHGLSDEWFFERLQELGLDDKSLRHIIGLTIYASWE